MACALPTPPVPTGARNLTRSRRRTFARLVPPLALLALTACSSRLGAPKPVTEEGEDILSLWRVLFWSAAAIGLLVVVLIAWCLVRYRARGQPEGAEPPQLHGNVPLELAYIAAPLVLVAVLFGLSIATQNATADVTRRPALPIEVTGFQWQWRFHYPTEGVSVLGTPTRPPELVLPAGTRVRLLLRSADVIHSFYVPGFLTKRDLVPGVDNELEVRPVRPGVYHGNCAEFCGLDHARMGFTVLVVTPDKFEQWTASARAAGLP